VFLWHATGWAALSWIGAMPVMFYLNGFFFALSVSKRGYAATLLDRAKRLFVPFWLFSTLAVAVMVLYAAHAHVDQTWPTTADLWRWFLPVLDPHGTTWQQGWISRPLWYLRAYIWIMAAAPALLWLLRRTPRLVLVSLSIAVLSMELVFHTALWEIQDFALYSVFFLLGALASQGAAPAARWARTAGLALIGLSFLVAFALKPEGFVANNSHTVSLVSGAGWLLLAIGYRAALSSAAHRLGGVLRSFSSKSLTVYLYHAPMIGVGWLIAGRVGTVGPTVRVVLATLVGSLLTWAAVGVVGWVEDFASSNALRIRTFRRTWRISILGSALAAWLLLPAVSVALPPTPSRAPTADISVTPAEAAVLLGEEGAASPQAFRTDRVQENHLDPARAVVVTPPPGLAPVAPIEDLAPEVSDETAAKLETLLSAWVTGNKIGAVEVSVLKPGVAHWRSAVDASGTHVKNAAGVQFASVTKSFTGTLVLRAIDEGRLSIDQELGVLDAAPWFTLAEHTTIRELLTHQSGLVSYSLSETYKADWRDVYDWESALNAVEKDGLLFAPGGKTEYSSTNFILLGLLLEQLYGDPIEDLISTKLLKPLALGETKVLPPSAGAPGSGTGNMFGSMDDTLRWAFVRWRENAVLGPYSSSLSEFIGAATHLGLAEFGYCPCQKKPRDAASFFAAVGHDGGEHTLRWYRGPDVIISIHTNHFADPTTDAFIAEVIRTLTTS
jgi:CubicO group peptidase (beta-lactamase class C family)/peptidoglycan/LPS O-acetylase OafA/YrhL